MPPRFVEVLDVGSEASSILTQLASRATEFASEVRVNVSQYINATTGEYDVNLLSFLSERYNISTDDVLSTLTALNLTNSTLAQVPPPTGMAGWLILAGACVLLARAIVVRLQATRFVRNYGHTHAE